MTRRRFGGDTSTVLIDSTGAAGGAIVTFWTALTGGTQVTDLLAMDGTTAIPFGQLQASNEGALPSFLGPDNDTSEMYVEGGLGTRLLITANDTAVRVKAIEDQGVNVTLGDGAVDRANLDPSVQLGIPVAFASGLTLQVNQLVLYGDQLFRTNTAHTTGSTPDANKLTAISGGSGAGLLSTSGKPANTVGADGATALDYTNARLYKKAAGAWDAGVSLIGPKGDAGGTGADAYAVAVAAGFSGTRTDWLTSLHGAPGDPGQPGPDGGASVALAQLSDGDNRCGAGVLIGPRNVVTPVTAYAAVSPKAPSYLEDIVYDVVVHKADGTTVSTGGTATLALGTYRAVFASQVALPAGSSYDLVPSGSGAVGSTLVFQQGSAFAAPASITAPGKPTNVTVSRSNGVAVVSWVPPVGGVAPRSYVVVRQSATGAPYAAAWNVAGASTKILGDAPTDSYAVEATVPGRGSGLTAFVSSGTASTGPVFTTLDSSGQNDSTAIPTTVGGSFIADVAAGSPAGTAVFFSGRRVLTAGQGGATANQGVKLAGFGAFDPSGGFIFRDELYIPDTTSIDWIDFAAPGVDPITGTSTRFIRAEFTNLTVQIAAKAPGVAFGAGTVGGYFAIPKAGGGNTSSFTPGLGTTGRTVVIEFTPPVSGAMTVNVYLAAIADFASAYPGSAAVTLVHTVQLTSGQVTALFGTPGSALTLEPWEAVPASSTVVKAGSFGPLAGLRIGA